MKTNGDRFRQARTESWFERTCSLFPDHGPASSK